MEIIKVEHNGVNYFNCNGSDKVDAIANIGEKRFVIRGTPKIVIMENSWKFGKQLQFGLFCNKEDLVEEGRNDSKWNMVEINIPFEEGKKMIKEIYKEIFEK